MAEAYRLWRDVAGLVVVKEGEEDGLRLSLLQAGNSYVELLQPLDATSETAEFLERTGGGMDHLCLQVPDIDAAHRAANERGLPLIWGGEVSHVFTGDAFFVAPEATQGVLVELLQPDAVARPGEKGEGLFEQLMMVSTVSGNLPGAVGLWERNFGLRAETYLVGPDDRRVLVPAGAGGAACVEVRSPLEAAGQGAAREGLLQLSVRSEDPERAAALLAEAGYRTEGAVGFEHGRPVYFVHPESTGGVSIAIAPPGPFASGRGPG